MLIYLVDYNPNDSLIPIIGYEIYHPLNKSKLDLKYCEDILIKLNIPVSIDESKLFKYDPNSEFYNDNCFPFIIDFIHYLYTYSLILNYNIRENTPNIFYYNSRSFITKFATIFKGFVLHLLRYKSS